MTGRYGAVDVHYPGTGGAHAALVVAGTELFEHLSEERTAWLPEVAEYQPGRFYLRELPALEAVLATATALDLLIVDGYADLDPTGTPGLGTHVHRSTGLPVIGVAKTAFHQATHAIEVRRGTATKPLFVTTAGYPLDEAAALVTAMAGPFRMPDALRRVDSLARSRP